MKATEQHFLVMSCSVIMYKADKVVLCFESKDKMLKRNATFAQKNVTEQYLLVALELLKIVRFNTVVLGNWP